MPNQHIDYVYQPTHVPIGYWRAVGASHNGFFIEGFIDEVAHATGQDPVELPAPPAEGQPARPGGAGQGRRRPSGWGQPLPPGHGRGIAFCENVESIVAQVAEVSVVNDVLRVHRVVAVDRLRPR